MAKCSDPPTPNIRGGGGGGVYHKKVFWIPIIFFLYRVVKATSLATFPDNPAVLVFYILPQLMKSSVCYQI